MSHKIKYRIRYYNEFYYLQERRRFLFIPYWWTISAAYNLEVIERRYTELTTTAANVQN